MNVQLIASMGPPSGGRAELNGRFQSKFNMLNFTFPSDASINLIFHEMLKFKLNKFGQDDIKVLAKTISLSNFQIYNFVKN
jgi:dynein heavy chain